MMRVRRETRARLEMLRQYRRETVDDLLTRLLDEVQHPDGTDGERGARDGRLDAAGGGPGADQ